MKYTVLLLLLIPAMLRAQPDTCSLKISLLTCTPGDELYSTFGHSAYRVSDASKQLDVIFNYGTFDFEDPDFYKKFVRGKLLYFVSVDSLSRFLMEYEYFHRGITEQVLNLTCQQKSELAAALFENAKEENKYYPYDFTYDNCTTRLRDMLEKITGKPLQSKDIRPGPTTTFRDLIHVYLDKGNQQWSKLGIDILLGKPLDKKVSNREAMFLPDNMMFAFDSSYLNNERLVLSKNVLLPAVYGPKKKSFFTPFVVLGLLFILIAGLSFLVPVSNSFLRAFDVFFFMIIGLLGFLILFMWFGTDHIMCKNNLNLLWALPTHFPVALFLFSRKLWPKQYFKFVFYYSIALLITWFLLPQHLNPALLPVMGIILIRSFFISKTN